MKLIDLLVQELPKRGGWPKSANCITQDGDLRVEPAYCHPSVAKCYDDGFWFLDSSRIGGFGVDTLASDYTTAIITREQYEAALSAKNDGWIDWGGGECPVSDSTIVEVRYRNGEVKAAAPADFYEWGRVRPHFVTTGRDIIAYRLHQPQESEQTKEDDEANLNECIGQDDEPVWNGEGLPPVGCGCECQFLDSWHVCNVLFVGEEVIVGVIDGSERAFSVNHTRFRPPLSEADKKRDEVINEIASMIGRGTFYEDADRIYDAIAAGKIPGVKLDD